MFLNYHACIFILCEIIQINIHQDGVRMFHFDLIVRVVVMERKVRRGLFEGIVKYHVTKVAYLENPLFTTAII